MSPGNPSRLLKLADREFRQLTGKPVAPVPSRKFKPVKLNAAKFDSAWDRKRGAAESALRRQTIEAGALEESDTRPQLRVVSTRAAGREPPLSPAPRRRSREAMLAPAPAFDLPGASTALDSSGGDSSIGCHRQAEDIMVTHDQELLAQLAAQIAAGVIARTGGIGEALKEPNVVDISMRIAKAIQEAAKQP